MRKLMAISVVTLSHFDAVLREKYRFQRAARYRLNAGRQQLQRDGRKQFAR